MIQPSIVSSIILKDYIQWSRMGILDLNLTWLARKDIVNSCEDRK